MSKNFFGIIYYLVTISILISFFLYIYTVSINNSFLKPAIITASIKNAPEVKLAHTTSIIARKYIDDFVPNYFYIINNNIAQYSVYLTKLEDAYKIEAYVFFYYKKMVDHSKIENYYCLVKLLNVKGYHDNHEIIQLNTLSTPGYYFDSNRKFVFKFSPKDFKSFAIDSNNFKIENIVVAVIRKEDYSKDLSENDLNSNLTDNENYDKKFALPYSLIVFQQVAYSESNQVSKTVSSCVHFTYGRVMPYFENWVDMHLTFGVAEIMFYDSTPGMVLTKYVENMNSNKKSRIKVKPYKITEEELCNDALQPKTEFKKIKQLLKANCLSFYKFEFKDFIGGRTKHEQITSNDCITDFSKKHEYITYYDLDEFVFPRALNITQQELVKCDDRDGICSLKPFEVTNSNLTQESSMYNYLDNLVNKYRGNRDKSRLAAITFQHSAYLIEENIVDHLFANLGIILQSLDEDKSNLTFPILIVFHGPSNPIGHTFIIEKNDIEYIRYLYNSYYSLAKCLFNNSIKKMNSTLDVSLQRFVYLITEHEQRWPKSILVGKNMEATFLHFPTQWIPGSWDFKPDASDGHMLPHFRDDISWLYYGNFNGSIRKLNIDFEYLFFIVKKFSNYCKI